MSYLNAGRFQFVWWGVNAEMRFKFSHWEEGLANIYDWSISVGPLEIRKWHLRAPDTEKAE